MLDYNIHDDNKQPTTFATNEKNESLPDKKPWWRKSNKTNLEESKKGSENIKKEKDNISSRPSSKREAIMKYLQRSKSKGDKKDLNKNDDILEDLSEMSDEQFSDTSEKSSVSLIQSNNPLANLKYADVFSASLKNNIGYLYQQVENASQREEYQFTPKDITTIMDNGTAGNKEPKDDEISESTISSTSSKEFDNYKADDYSPLTPLENVERNKDIKVIPENNDNSSTPCCCNDEATMELDSQSFSYLIRIMELLGEHKITSDQIYSKAPGLTLLEVFKELYELVNLNCEKKNILENTLKQEQDARSQEKMKLQKDISIKAHKLNLLEQEKIHDEPKTSSSNEVISEAYNLPKEGSSDDSNNNGDADRKVYTSIGDLQKEYQTKMDISKRQLVEITKELEKYKGALKQLEINNNAMEKEYNEQLRRSRVLEENLINATNEGDVLRSEKEALTAIKIRYEEQATHILEQLKERKKKNLEAQSLIENGIERVERERKRVLDLKRANRFLICRIHLIECYKRESLQFMSQLANCFNSLIGTEVLQEFEVRLATLWSKDNIGQILSMESSIETQFRGLQKEVEDFYRNVASVKFLTLISNRCKSYKRNNIYLAEQLQKLRKHYNESYEQFNKIAIENTKMRQRQQEWQ
ncbi:Spo21p NDAI_0G05120 [Naumovozyma dairenensis CBS 421]|uniref:Uncharacterized protein n=1 Tax=Naumovozyma dairenensis (strain ATCC 10597 / BCRC 20456 / CBS 421 / NBRC 0211 / NRRL Y-12639) TaxID=1071378 RepID=J7SBR2_NAUDC|nr:hypothetical protein NDAI_0G05120 [Naumovozyma dairenensis CBS 421]CCK73495.1 hypothetical protein NDAI_0G05120 [Naumovozyma dairenensis CBS 421]